MQPTFTASQYRALSVLGCGHTSSTKCYGCASAVTEHCITLLRALATNAAIRHILVSQGLIRELFDYNLRRGAATMREEVRQLMCLLTRLVQFGVRVLLGLAPPRRRPLVGPSVGLGPAPAKVSLPRQGCVLMGSFP